MRSCWWLVLVLGCRAPDQVTVTPGYGWTEADFTRGLDQSYEGESYGLYLGLSWDMGERRRVRREGAERAARMESLELAHAAHEGVVVNVPSPETLPDAPESTEAEEGWSLIQKGLVAIGGSLAALAAAWLQARARKPRAEPEEASEEE